MSGAAVAGGGSAGGGSSDQVEQAHKLNATINKQAAELAEQFDALDAARKRAEHNEQIKAEYLAALAEDLVREVPERRQATVAQALEARQVEEPPQLDRRQGELRAVDAPLAGRPQDTALIAAVDR